VKLENSLHIFIFSVGWDGSAVTHFHVYGTIAWEPVEEACSTFYVVQAILAKFGMHASNMKFNTQNV
jgi:hypothetical protein